MKRILILVIAMAVLCSWTFAAAPPESKTYDTKEGKVTFPHKAHITANKVKCNECHHAGKMQACSTCHTAEGAEKTPKLHDAIHGKGKFSCATCHAAKKAEHPKAPTECKDCHKKG